MARFTSETGRKARQRKAGLASARVNRLTGFENLRIAREVQAHKREMREHSFTVSVNGFQCSCGKSGDYVALIKAVHRWLPS